MVPTSVQEPESLGKLRRPLDPLERSSGIAEVSFFAAAREDVLDPLDPRFVALHQDRQGLGRERESGVAAGFAIP